MKKNYRDIENLESRSKKVRRMLGEEPPELVCWGTGILAFVFLLLILGVSLLPYPYSDGESIFEHIFLSR